MQPGQQSPGLARLPEAECWVPSASIPCRHTTPDRPLRRAEKTCGWGGGPPGPGCQAELGNARALEQAAAKQEEHLTGAGGRRHPKG